MPSLVDSSGLLRSYRKGREGLMQDLAGKGRAGAMVQRYGLCRMRRGVIVVPRLCVAEDGDCSEKIDIKYHRRHPEQATPHHTIAIPCHDLQQMESILTDPAYLGMHRLPDQPYLQLLHLCLDNNHSPSTNTECPTYLYRRAACPQYT